MLSRHVAAPIGAAPSLPIWATACRLRRAACVLLLLYILACPLAALSDEAMLHPADGEPFTARLVSISEAGQIKFEGQKQSGTMETRDLLSYGGFVDPLRGPQLYLADGGIVIADLIKSDADILRIDSAIFGEQKLPLEQLLAVVLHPPADAQRRDRLVAGLLASKGDADRLVLDNGDELTGTIKTFGLEKIEFQSRVGTVEVETARIAALAMNPSLAARSKATRLRTIVGFEDGSRIVASRVTVDGAQVQITDAEGLSWAAPRQQLRALQVLDGVAVYLSDLKPAGYKHIPFLDLPWPYQNDKNCLGTQLRVGKAVYLKGLGMHSTSRLTYALSGQRRFAAEMCVDAATAGRGSVVYRLFADAEQVYASPIVRGDMQPLGVAIDLPQAAKSLSLIVDFAERGDELDHANWLNARLVP